MVSPTGPAINSPDELLGREVADDLGAQSKGNARQFTFSSLEEVTSRPPKQFLLAGAIGDQDLAMLVGAPKSAKTLLALEFSAMLMKGGLAVSEDYLRVSSPTCVVYACGEGYAGLPNRLIALNHKYDFSQEERGRLIIVEQVPQLYLESSALSIDRFVEEFIRLYGPDCLKNGLLIIDTWARGTVGADENSAKETSVIVDAISHARDRLQCCILVLHHENRLGQTRGSTNIPAAFDSIFRVRQDEGGLRRLSLEFGKDVGDFPDLGFQIRIHEWSDAEGTVHKGPYIEWVGELDRNRANKRENPNDQRVLAALRRYCQNRVKALPVGELIKHVDDGIAKQTATDCLQRLLARGLVKREHRTPDHELSRCKNPSHHWWLEEEDES